MHHVWIVCTQCMSICSLVKGHSVGSPTGCPFSKYSILGRSPSISDSLVTNKHTDACWRKAGRASRNSIWPPLSMRYIQSRLRTCCGSGVVAIWRVVLSSADFAVCSTRECAIGQQQHLSLLVVDWLDIGL